MRENYKKRASLSYENLSGAFLNTSRDFTKQYCSIYLTRLKQFRSILKERCKLKWGGKYPLVELHKLSEAECNKCIVIGTLFKDQKLKPSILKQISEVNQLVPQPILNHFTDNENDTLYIEDELERYQIIGALDKKYLVTGITCALLGKDSGDGKFEVSDFTFGDFRTQVERPIFTDDAFIVILSGLDLVNLEKTNVFLEIFTYWLSGLLDLDSVSSSKISRVIIAGNSVRTIREQFETKISMTSRVPESGETIEAVKILDKFLAKLTKVIEVDVMPGENDPSNHILPQQPLHHCMFPESYKWNSLNLVTNPYKFKVDGVEILGTSGQNVRDVMRFSEIPDAVDCLEKCLEWCHLAPTAPDTLGCFPFYNQDPFIFQTTPHCFFAGNQTEFGTKLIDGPEGQNVRLISIPEFSSSHEIVLLNLKNFECFPVKLIM